MIIRTLMLLIVIMVNLDKLYTYSNKEYKLFTINNNNINYKYYVC